MKCFLAFCLGVLSISLWNPLPAKAASENDCAIWLCLPAGFPSGCGGAYNAFKDRIKHGRAPLPNLLSCTTGPNGEGVDGKYQLGREPFELCDEGYVLREENNDDFMSASCVATNCASSQWGGDEQSYCEHYDAIQRSKPRYIKMWVDGGYLCQYFY